MLWAATAVLCETGRGAGMRVTEGRLFTGRRSAGRASGLGAATFRGAATFFDAGLATRRAGFLTFATLRLAGRFVLPLPFPDLRLAMIASRLPPSMPALSHRVRRSLQLDIEVLQQLCEIRLIVADLLRELDVRLMMDVLC